MPPVDVFISYSRKDAKLVDKFVLELRSLEFDNIIRIWIDHELRADSIWEQELMGQLNKAGAIIFLLSAGFQSPGYARDKELPRALERHAAGDVKLIFVHLQTCRIAERIHKEFNILPNTDQGIDKRPGVAKAVVDKIALVFKDRPSQSLPAIREEVDLALRYLPYLCDRTSQAGPLQRIPNDPARVRRPIAFILSGPDLERHDGFHLRAARDIVPAALCCAGQSEPRPVTWPAEPQAREAKEDLIWSVQRALGATGSVSLETIVSQLPEGLTYLRTVISGDGWNSKHRDLLEGFLNFWNDWPDLPPNRIVCMAISIAWESKGPDDDRLFKMFPEGDYPRLRFRVLPDLQSPRRQDALDWLLEPRVKERYAARNESVDLNDKVRDAFGARPAMSMDELYTPLLTILKDASS